MRYLNARSGVKHSGPRIFVVLATALGVLAADASWRSKPPAQWTAQEASEILSASPWTKEIRADIARRQTEDQLREGGQLGQPEGLGYDGVDEGVKGYRPSFNIFTGKGGDDRSERSMIRPGALPLGLRWESALPIRLAKLKLTDDEPVALDGEGYQIGVYGIPDSKAAKGDPERLGEALKKTAYLKRVGKKDVRPIRVEVFHRENGPIIIYLFPLSAELATKDGIVEFEAHIGRISIAQNFDLREMEFMGKLQL